MDLALNNPQRLICHKTQITHPFPHTANFTIGMTSWKCRGESRQPDLKPLRFLPLRVPQGQNRSQQLSHHWCIKCNHHWEDLSDHQWEICNALSTTFHAAFNSAFHWTVNIWSMYFWAPLDIWNIYTLNCVLNWFAIWSLYSRSPLDIWSMYSWSPLM